jgi:hypothetical protein
MQLLHVWPSHHLIHSKLLLLHVDAMVFLHQFLIVLFHLHLYVALLGHAAADPRARCPVLLRQPPVCQQGFALLRIALEVSLRWEVRVVRIHPGPRGCDRWGALLDRGSDWIKKVVRTAVWAGAVRGLGSRIAVSSGWHRVWRREPPG